MQSQEKGRMCIQAWCAEFDLRVRLIYVDRNGLTDKRAVFALSKFKIITMSFLCSLYLVIA